MNKTATSRLALAAAAVVAGLACLTPALAQQGQPQQAAGQAEVRQMNGPTFDLKGNSDARLVVLFPGSTQGGQQGGLQGMQLVLVEKQAPQQSGGQEQGGGQAQMTNTGREILLRPASAVDGLVAHQFDRSGNDRQYMLVTRGVDRQLDVRQAGGGDGVTLFRVQAQPDESQQQQYQQQQEQYQQQMQAYQEQQRQAQEQAAAQQQNQEGQEGQQAGQGDNAQLAAGQQAQQPQQPQAPQPTDVAVIMVYSGSSQR